MEVLCPRASTSCFERVGKALDYLFWGWGSGCCALEVRESGDLDRNAISQSCPASLSSSVTTAAHSGAAAGGGGVRDLWRRWGFWSFLWEESLSKRVQLERRISISMLPGKLPSPEIY